MTPTILIGASIALLLVFFIIWKRVMLAVRVTQAHRLMLQLLEPYLNLVPLFFTIYEQYIPKQYLHLRSQGTALLVMNIQSGVEATLDVLHFLQEMDELLEELNRKPALKDNAQFQLVEQDFKTKHMQLRNSIYALELHDYLKQVRVLYPA